MKKPLSCICLVLGLPAIVHAQAIRVADFGFSAGIAARPAANASAQMSGNLRLTTARLAMELNAASASSGDRSVDANVLSSLYRRFAVGAGIGLHSQGSAALNGVAALRLPLADRDAAVLEISARGAIMRSARQVGFFLSVHLSPRRGLQLGERLDVPVTVAGLAGSWSAVVDEIMLQQETLPQIEDVIATESTVIVKLRDVNNAEIAVARVARVLNGASDAVDLTISAPDPVRFAAAATSAGFPAERIALSGTERGITLQATRHLALSAIRSARSSRRR